MYCQGADDEGCGDGWYWDAAEGGVAAVGYVVDGVFCRDFGLGLFDGAIIQFF